ncbi:hypothetical protein BKA82DRAFT_1001544 [Pisolithus tinctorius]|uniref:Uncharacterized protein n=1 Tax=Pisolithus tinctorius Marx 270 TaxID=870435 RepID=A0A0C3P6R5_PISTI|nr:hypothetical protein BKA82DRAFT_1001544 [Pisolithus tinctorius]KIO03271.1 hypothetical protein M404DRAFT_1001544 [Pisolithus tinctorius Marx 270]
MAHFTMPTLTPYSPQPLDTSLDARVHAPWPYPPAKPLFSTPSCSKPPLHDGFPLPVWVDIFCSDYSRGCAC